MAEPPNAVLNGPSPENNVPFKDAQAAQETIKSSEVSLQQLPGFYSPRPSLTRLDSRSTLPVRPGYPLQQGVGIRPQQIRQTLSAQPQFIQRPPGTTARPPGPPQFAQNLGVRPTINPNFRPPTPFPRAQVPTGVVPPGVVPPGVVPRQPGIFQQRSVPSYSQPRSILEVEQLLRSQTLDSSDLTTGKHPENAISEQEDPPRTSLSASRNYNPSASESHNLIEEERRRSISSTGSAEERKSVTGSTENLDKKSDGDYPSRPESRASSRMNKIREDDVDKIRFSNKSPSPQTDPSPKSVDFVLPVNEVKSKSPSPIPSTRHEKTDDVVVKAKQESPKNVLNGFEEKLQERKAETRNLELKNLKKSKSPSRSEGDNDSGVDESTQGNDQSSNGDQNSPRKSSGKLPNRTSSTTPTKNRSLSRGSKSPSLKSPDSTASTPGTTEKKKVPMNKVQVGSAPSPNLKVVRSKIGSLENASYKPGGGNVKIETKKADYKNASSRIEAKNDKYAPKGGEKKIQQQKLQWTAKSKVGSLENATHQPKGSEKKIENLKLDFKDKAKSKVGSKDNIKHMPGGGDVKIENKKLNIKAQSKIGSLDNVKHVPGGGDKKIFDDKDYMKQMSTISSENHSLSGSQNSLPSQPEAGGPVADENLNQER